MYTQRVPYFDANGKLRPYLHEARKRGVKFDVGHGGGSFSWSNAKPARSQDVPRHNLATQINAIPAHRALGFGADVDAATDLQRRVA